MIEDTFGDNPLAKTRNILMDLQATIHIMAAYKGDKEWTCECECCEYVRKEPRLAMALYRAVSDSMDQDKTIGENITPN